MDELGQAALAAAERAGLAELAGDLVEGWIGSQQQAEEWLVPPSASIKLAEGHGHLLDGATITSWAVDDVLEGRCE